jgi:hypothetical protein
VAPFIYGIMGDLVGVPATLVVIAAVGLATLPLCVALRPVIAAAGRAA